jgi:hypothetical protein
MIYQFLYLYQHQATLSVVHNLSPSEIHLSRELRGGLTMYVLINLGEDEVQLAGVGAIVKALGKTGMPRRSFYRGCP